MDQARYYKDPAYRAMVDGARRGGQSRSRSKLRACASNLALMCGRPRDDGLPPGWWKKGLTEEQAREWRDDRRWAQSIIDMALVMQARGWLLFWELECDIELPSDLLTIGYGREYSEWWACHRTLERGCFPRIQVMAEVARVRAIIRKNDPDEWGPVGPHLGRKKYELFRDECAKLHLKTEFAKLRKIPYRPVGRPRSVAIPTPPPAPRDPLAGFEL